MQTIRIAFALTLLAAVAGAQQPAEKIVATSSEITAMVAKAKKERKPDQPTFAQPLLALAPYGANLEYRAAVGPSVGPLTPSRLPSFESTRRFPKSRSGVGDAR